MFPTSYPRPPASGTSMQLLSTVVANDSATVAIEATFDATYSDYLLLITDVKSASGSILQISTRHNGAYAGTLNVAGTTTSGGVTTIHNIQTSVPTSLTSINASSSATIAGVSGEFWIKEPSNPGRGKNINYQISQNSAASTAYTAGVISNNTTTAALTGVRFSFVTGNIASGTFRLYGIPKV